MTVVTVSPKFQVVIPKEIREALGIRSGQKVQMIQYDNQIVLIPVRSLKDARGFLAGSGIDTAVEREDDRL